MLYFRLYVSVGAESADLSLGKTQRLGTVHRHTDRAYKLNAKRSANDHMTDAH